MMGFLTCRATITMFVVVLISLLFVSPAEIQSQDKSKEIEKVEDALEVFKNLLNSKALNSPLLSSK